MRSQCEGAAMSDGVEVVATGTWLYDRTAPRPISIMRKPATMADSRFDWETTGQVDESRPVPETKDGFLYFCSLGRSGEYLDIESAKAWADAQPWGPVSWDS
jgi:hypothetical protein